MSYDDDSVIISGTEDNDTDSYISSNSSIIDDDNNHYFGDYGIGQQVTLRTIDDDPWRLDSWSIREIEDIENDFRDSDKVSGNYYIGLASRDALDGNYMLGIAISPSSFFRYSYFDLWNYLNEYNRIDYQTYYRDHFRDAPDGGLIYHRPKINIMKLTILPSGVYSVTIKTFWIRLIQRHWRKTLIQRAQMLRRRMSPPEFRYREIHGRYSPYLRNLPGLYGMLECYCHSNQ